MNEMTKTQPMLSAKTETVVVSSFNQEDPLGALYSTVMKKVEGAMEYYGDRKRSKRFWAQHLRFVAIALVSLAALIPLLQAVGVGASVDGFDSGQVGVLLAGIGGAAIGMDKFFGFSSSWTRFTMAEIDLEEMRDKFQLDWAIANMSIEPEDPELKVPLQRLQLLKDFSMEVSRINKEETKVWIREFQSALAALEKSTKEKQGAEPAGGIQVTIDRGDDVDKPVTVMMNGQVNSETNGNSVVIRRVPAGEQTIEVIGTRKDGKSQVKASQKVTVPSGGMAPVTLQLA